MPLYMPRKVCKLKGNNGIHGIYSKNPVTIKKFKNIQVESGFIKPTTRKLSWNDECNIKHSRYHSYIHTKSEGISMLRLWLFNINIFLYIRIENSISYEYLFVSKCPECFNFKNY